MKYFNILFVLLIMLSCRNSEKKRELVEVNFHNNSIDSVSSDKFFKKNKLEYFLQGLDTLHPRCIDWGKDRHDRYMYGIYIDNKLMRMYQTSLIDTIYHPERVKQRLYIYDHKIIRTTRILTDSLKFNFDDVTFVLDKPEIYRKDSFIIWMAEPAGWFRLGRKYKFIAIFDFSRVRCYEALINPYSIYPCPRGYVFH